MPLALLLVLTAGYGLPSTLASTKEMPDDTRTSIKKLSNLDIPGVITFALTMATFLALSALGGQRFAWDHPVILCTGAACTALGIIFILIQGFIAKRPLIPLQLLRSNGIGMFCMIQILLFVARFAVSRSLSTSNF